MSAAKSAVSSAQQVLNGSGSKLSVDGSWGPKTEAAFKAADARTQQLVLRELAKSDLSPEKIQSYQRNGGDQTKAVFKREVEPAVLDAAKRLGLNGNLMIAQLRHESGGGGRIPPGSNNWGGIKARAGEPVVQAMTTEKGAGNALVKVSQPFRKFATPKEFADYYVTKLATSKRYASAYTSKDVLSGAMALQKAGYATDPQYAVKLASIARQQALA